ncbi:MAG TPA: HRDC domain-containing protein [Anaerolineae bacterium]|nr:HRDC domain-containing protein [Anaerolineae bacterium]
MSNTPNQAFKRTGQGSSHPQPPVVVDSAEALHALVLAAQQVPVISVDTESNSLFAYFHRVCLLQISLPDHDYVIDPLAVDLTPLGGLFADPACQKIFHAAENDILGLKRDYQFTFANIFDTMLAARILGWPQAGLAGILAVRFDVHLNKSLQRADWGQRPLDPALLAYAQLDTHYLLPLRDQQEAELRARDRWDEALESFARLPQVEWVEKPFDVDGFWSLPGARDLSPSALAVLQQLFLWREQQARNENRPPFKIIDQRTLVTISRQQPAAPEALRRIGGMTSGQARRYGTALLQAVARGRKAPVPAPPKRSNGNGYSRPDPKTSERFDALRSWRTERARQRGVDPDVILTNDQLMTIARQAPTTVEALAATNAMGPWKLSEYGEAILRLLARS